MLFVLLNILFCLFNILLNAFHLKKILKNIILTCYNQIFNMLIFKLQTRSIHLKQLTYYCFIQVHSYLNQDLW